MSLLEVRKVTLRFGGLTAVNQVDLSVEPGQIFSVIGPNGAGKTTVFNAITGVYEPTEGAVLFQGADLRRPFVAKVMVGIALVALLTGLLSVAAIHLEPMWVATVEANYRFKQPFPWGKAWSDLFSFLGKHALSVSVSLLLGAALGAAGSWVVWQRQRRMPNVVSERGVCRTFQNIRLFQEMTVLENVLMGMDRHLKTRVWHSAFRLPLHFRDEGAATARARELLEFVGLKGREGMLAKNLPYGDQRRLEIARALATKPTLLLLDEPAAGMNPFESIDLMKLIRKIRDTGITVLLIEHHMKVVMGISDRIAVLQYGSKIAEGTPEEIKKNPTVIEAYLGREEVH